MAFHNLPKTLKDQILDYKLMVYFCSGTDQEKLDWFRIINIAGERLTEQELRNAVYTGPWLTHAKTIFSKTGGAAYLLASKYVNGSPIRQDYWRPRSRGSPAGRSSSTCRPTSTTRTPTSCGPTSRPSSGGCSRRSPRTARR